MLSAHFLTPPYVVVGGGVAGASCAEELAAVERGRPQPRGVLLLSASGRLTLPMAAAACAGSHLQLLRETAVREVAAEEWPAARASGGGLVAMAAAVLAVDAAAKTLRVAPPGGGAPQDVAYFRLCL